MKATKESVNFREQSPINYQRCGNCVAAIETAQRGRYNCALVQGNHAATNWCSKWAELFDAIRLRNRQVGEA